MERMCVLCKVGRAGGGLVCLWRVLGRGGGRKTDGIATEAFVLGHEEEIDYERIKSCFSCLRANGIWGLCQFKYSCFVFIVHGPNQRNSGMESLKPSSHGPLVEEAWCKMHGSILF
jgi:hypothetical protein